MKSTIETTDLLMTLQQMSVLAEERFKEFVKANDTEENRRLANGDQIAIDHLVLTLSNRVGDPDMWKAWTNRPERVEQHDRARVMHEFRSFETVCVRLATNACTRMEAVATADDRRRIDFVATQLAAEEVVDHLADLKQSLTTLLRAYTEEG